VIDQDGEPEKITIDKSGANTAAIDSYNAEHEADIEMRQCKYLANIVEQDHRAIKRVVRPMLGFKSGASSNQTTACRAARPGPPHIVMLSEQRNRSSVSGTSVLRLPPVYPRRRVCR
jgi:transposase-like protein